MTEVFCKQIADAIQSWGHENAEVWHMAGGLHLTVVHREDGSLLGINEECVCVYPNEQAITDGEPTLTISLSCSDGDIPAGVAV